MRKERYTTPSGQPQYRPILTELELYDEETMGFCLSCGAFAEGVEPDARRDECEDCGASAVFGLEELVMIEIAVIE